MPRQEDDMKVITTNRLNRFWKNGVLPIKNALANKLNTSSVVNNLLTTAAGYALDARQGKALDDKITALNGKLTRVQLYKSTGTNTLTIPNLNTYSTVIIYAMAGDYCVSVVAVRESSIKNFVLSTYHSATYNICGEITIDFSAGKITTSRTTGNGWGVDRLYIREVYGYK